MSTLFKIVLFQLFIIIPFALGQTLQKRFSVELIQKWSKISYHLAVFLFDSSIALLVFWQASFQRLDILLPLGGFLMISMGLLFAHIYAKKILFLKERKIIASFALAASMSNHGYTMGGAIAFLLFGLEGLSRAMIYLLYFFPTVFTLLFSYGQWASSPQGKGKVNQELHGKTANHKWRRLQRLIWNRRNIPILFTLLGIALNIGRVPRFLGISNLLLILILINLMNVFFSFGLSMKLNWQIFLNPWLKHILLIKFIIIPVFMLLSLVIIELFFDLDLLSRWIWFLQSLMPAAIYSVLITRIFALGQDNVNEIFMGTTVIFITVVLPLLMLSRPWIEYLLIRIA